MGNAIGVYDLKDVLDEIFGEAKDSEEFDSKGSSPLSFKMIDKSLPADCTVEEFAAQFGYTLSDIPDETLGEVMQEKLGHQADLEETVYIGPYEMTVKEISLRGIKTIHIRTRRG